ncbi:MAG: bifunctional (p)ppGpp synthetase/guanosine-3',5'-bis(diphosphate) 3'-pyrophosphohydrolase [Prevotella sp.]|nr:bifunctional (p)ppGpp synthetase/guanosine-3',5'-bis(diphosphate) 3'-pyrophosphohydrolase [Prevotella sp.]
MNNIELIFTEDERREAVELLGHLRSALGDSLNEDDDRKMRSHLLMMMEQQGLQRDIFGLNPIVQSLRTAIIAVDEEGLKRDGVIAIMLYSSVINAGQRLGSAEDEDVQHEEQEQLLATIQQEYGTSVATIIRGLVRIQQLYKKNPVIESENFRNLLLSFAEDMRVILIMIADRVSLMRQIRDTDNEEGRRRVSEEASYLYAPLAHKLGLYKLKSELEDLSLKYLEHDAYYMIKDKLNATKKSRDAYIEKFIAPIEEKLRDAGLRFHMKGRTKSIHSIWQKMKKQQCGFEGIYDLFAIRIILETDGDHTTINRAKEHGQCWQVFAIITNMYQSNPKRLRDWLTVPKSNGYESLHITVLGPEQKWVEVQIRTDRMDEVAERGLAAHWRYKGVKSGEGGLDQWLTSIRNALENNDSRQMMDEFKMDLYEDEVFVFTPKGDLLKFPKGATVLDFAYHIHSRIGGQCTGARINNKVVTLRYQLQSGDQVEVMTSSTQKPKQDWLGIVKTSRAKSKIRLALKDIQVKEAAIAKEMLERRMKNRKLEFDESTMNHLIKKMGFKETRDFYKQLAEGVLDTVTVIERYAQLQQRESGNAPLPSVPTQSAEDFVFENPNEEITYGSDDVIVIDKNLKGIDFQLAKCCRPIYGDSVFGFVTNGGGIKIHRSDCPNAREMRRRFPYRIVRAMWSGKGTAQYAIVLRVIGNDDIGIVNNITSIISKEENIAMRSINIESNDGLFSGNITVNIEDTTKLEALIKKIKTVKGVKQVTRI